MFNIGFSEMLFLIGLALILIGPKQLPELARSIGRLLNEIKRSGDAFQDDLKEATRDLHRQTYSSREPQAQKLQVPAEPERSSGTETENKLSDGRSNTIASKE